MLVLSRRQGETLIVNSNIRITILGTKGGEARLGIDAPRNIDVVREELLSRPNAGKKNPKS
jgi:carbon storage regulator